MIAVYMLNQFYDQRATPSLNPFPAKAFVPLVKITSQNSLSEKFCWPDVFVSKMLLLFRLHEKWKLKARGHTTPYRHAGTTLPRTSSDVLMTVNGFKKNKFCRTLHVCFTECALLGKHPFCKRDRGGCCLPCV